MDIEYKGGNCVVITHKKTTIVTDPNLELIGLKNQGSKAAVQLLTQKAFSAPNAEDALVIEGPGEYEIENISVRGVAAQAHTDVKGDLLSATIYRLSTLDVSLAIVGHIYPDLTEEQLEAIGVVDALIIPVGGNGYTLDATGAIKIIKAIDPKVVIPTHYAERGVVYPVPQAELEIFLKELGVAHQETPKLKLKSGLFGEVLTAYIITRTA